MKRRCIITLVLIIIVPLLTGAVYQHAHIVPWDECSELYRRYADCPGVEAAYIKDYRVNDTLTLCATVLEAQTDSAWSELYCAFSFIGTDPQDVNKKEIAKGNDVLQLLRKDNQCEFLDSTDIAVASKRDKYICVFHTDDLKQNRTLRHTIIDHIFLLVTTEQTLNNHENES